MASPFDYVSAFQQQGGGPFGSVMQGLQAGAQMAEMDQRRAALAAQAQVAQQKALAEQGAMQRMQDYQTRLSAVLANPNRTWADFEPVLALAPNKDAMDAVRTMAGQADKRVTENEQLFTANALLALETNPEVAKRLFDTRIAGETRPQNKQTLELARQAIDISPEKAAEMIELAGAVQYGKDWYDSVVKARQERRVAAKAPFDLRSAEAAAKKAEADVETAQITLKRLDAIQEAELRKATNEAEAASIRAKFAERRERAELDLKAAQAGASRASTAKTNFEVEQLKRKADEGPTPVYNAQAGGFVVAPTKANPNGGFIPLNAAADAQQQQAAARALRTIGYDPATQKDDVTELIKKSTGGMGAALSTEVLRFFNYTTSGREAIASLETAANTITLDLLNNRLGAGVSNTDREFVLGKLGDIANPYKPTDERLAAWTAAKNRMVTSGILPPSAPAAPSPAAPPPAGPRLPPPASPYTGLSNDEILRRLGAPPGSR